MKRLRRIFSGLLALVMILTLCHGMPFAGTASAADANVVVDIPGFANGTVKADKASYKIGDTITLTISPSAGYSQKLAINGEPLLLNWKSNTYRFVATEQVYTITGCFVPSLAMGTSDKWDTANQANGVINTYYTSGDSSWLGIDGGYESIAVNVKNYLPGEGGTGVDGFAVTLGFKMSNNKTYTFRVIKENGKYYHQRMGITDSAGKADWTKKELDAATIAAICSKGVDFKLERTAANVLTLSVNGAVYDTYTMDGVTAANTVARTYVGHYGNNGQYIAIPYRLSLKAGVEGIPFKTSDLDKYVIIYDADEPDYAAYAQRLADQIAAKYGKTLAVQSDKAANSAQYEILLGDTNRYAYQGRVMECSVTVDEGKVRINVGGLFSADMAVIYLCEKVFNGQALTLYNGEYYHTSYLTSSQSISAGTTARIMTSNVLADAFSDDSYKKANYRAEILRVCLCPTHRMW